MAKQIREDVRHEVMRLRVEERRSIDEIKERTGLSVGTLSALLKDHPLNESEVKERISRAAVKSNAARKYRPDQSNIAAKLNRENLSTSRKGQIAEAAVRYRLVSLGYEVWKPDFEGSRIDFIVSRQGAHMFVRLQVKWAKRGLWGKPLFSLRNGEQGKIRRLTSTDCDFVIGYDLETDIAFVTPIEECEGKNAKACEGCYAEAWHLLGI